MARVLIVEDEGMLLDMMCTYMRGAGHEVSGSKSYDEALSLAYEKSFDLWIFDVKIIGGNGFGIGLFIAKNTATSSGLKFRATAMRTGRNLR